MKICILARKRLKFNTRVVRQAKALSDAGHDVTVAALELPVKELMDATPEVKYQHIELDPWPAKVLRIVNKATGLFFKLINIVLRLFVMPVNKSLILKNKIQNIGSETDGEPVSGIKIHNKIPAQTIRHSIASGIRRLLIPYMDSAKAMDFSIKVRRLMSDSGFDYCQAHDSHALLAAKTLADINNARLVFDALEVSTDLAGNAADFVPNWLKNRRVNKQKAIIKKADKVICIGPALADWAAETYDIEKPVIIRNCCFYSEIEKNENIRKDLKLEENKKLALVVGSIYRYQGIEQLIQSIAWLDDEIHIALLGPITQPGYDRILHDLMSKHGVNHRIHFPPIQNANNVVNYASGADIGLIARQPITLNNKYCLPNKIFELIMARLPIATARLKNIEGIVKQYDIGIVFDESDPKNIAQSINRLMDKENYSYYKDNVNSAARELSWERESKKYIGIFN